MADLIEPTEEEKRGGWTAETLTKYLAERDLARSAVISHEGDAAKPARANSRWNPFKTWR